MMNLKKLSISILLCSSIISLNLLLIPMVLLALNNLSINKKNKVNMMSEMKILSITKTFMIIQN